MKVKPYIKASVRTKKAWDNLAKMLDLHCTIVREAYFNRWFTSVDFGDFINLIETGEITRDDVIEAGEDWMEIPVSELDKMLVKKEKASLENDDSDLLHYRCKQLIQLGDEIVSDETKTFCFSGKQYQTQGKRYKITSLDDKRAGLSGFTARTESDIEGEGIWWSSYGVKSLWRDGKEIWNWNLGYLQIFMENNPNHPDTQEMIDHCTAGAKLMAIGEKSH
jgi:hypothetical protein